MITLRYTEVRFGKITMHVKSFSTSSSSSSSKSFSTGLNWPTMKVIKSKQVAKGASVVLATNVYVTRSVQQAKKEISLQEPVLGFRDKTSIRNFASAATTWIKVLPISSPLQFSSVKGACTKDSAPQTSYQKDLYPKHKTNQKQTNKKVSFETKFRRVSTKMVERQSFHNRASTSRWHD